MRRIRNPVYGFSRTVGSNPTPSAKCFGGSGSSLLVRPWDLSLTMAPTYQVSAFEA